MFNRSLRIIFATLLVLCLTKPLLATNYFNWDLETATFVAHGTTVNPTYSGGASRVAGTGHSGSYSMYCPVPSAQNGNAPVGVSAPNSPDLSTRYPFTLVGGPSIYYRFWMKIMPGFSWAGGAQKTKASRTGFNGGGSGYTGYLSRTDFNISECSSSGCDPNSGGDNTAVIPYNMDAKADGNWHEYIIRVKGNTSGAHNAEFQVFIDGVSVGLIDATHGRPFLLSNLSGTYADQWGAWMLCPYWQAGGGGTMYLDDYSVDDVWNSTFGGGGPDVTPPIVSSGLPSGAQVYGTTQVTMSVVTDESATCKYGTASGQSYASKPNTFSTTGGTAHSSVIGGLTNGGSYTYYVRCSDSLGNINASDYVVSWSVSSTPPSATECPSNWQALHPAWIWCDDFETDKISSYFDNDSPIMLVRAAGTGYNGTYGRTASWISGQGNAGSLKLAFGKVPAGAATIPAGVDSTTIFRDIYYRVYMKSSANWVGQVSGHNSKFARATSFVASNWSQAMIAHLWSNDTNNNNNYLMTDPASCVTGSTVNCVGYNDFAHLVFLGASIGSLAIFTSTNVGNWNCIESHVKLNDAGLSNGIEEFWVDGVLNASRSNLNFVGSYATYGINILMLENFINGGASQSQSRNWDNFVVSTQPIGCQGAATAPAPPKNLRIQ